MLFYIHKLYKIVDCRKSIIKNRKGNRLLWLFSSHDTCALDKHSSSPTLSVQHIPYFPPSSTTTTLCVRRPSTTTPPPYHHHPLLRPNSPTKQQQRHRRHVGRQSLTNSGSSSNAPPTTTAATVTKVRGSYSDSYIANMK